MFIFFLPIRGRIYAANQYLVLYTVYTYNMAPVIPTYDTKRICAHVNRAVNNETITKTIITIMIYTNTRAADDY